VGKKVGLIVGREKRVGRREGMKVVREIGKGDRKK
jgi:hypothetical protein